MDPLNEQDPRLESLIEPIVRRPIDGLAISIVK